VGTIVTQDGEWLIAACADGAGSSEHSQIGSRIACDEFVLLAENAVRGAAPSPRLQTANVTEWCNRIHERLTAEAAQRSLAARDLACTFLGALVGESYAIFVQIGDGAIVFRAQDQYEVAIWPQSGEFANVTNFITDAGHSARLDVRLIEQQIDRIAIFTDGLERLVLRFHDKSVHSPFLEPFHTVLCTAEPVDPLFEGLASFLNSERVNERTDDDKTLILATRVIARDEDQEMS